MSIMRVVNGEMWLGDCLERMRQIPSGSIDMILCDLPYGTTACEWDQIIPFEPLWSEYWRVCKPNAAVVLTASQPFTSKLVMSQIKHFKYCWAWDKIRFSNQLFAKKVPLKVHEDIVVFYKNRPSYNPQGIIEINKITTQGKKVTDNIRTTGSKSGGIRKKEYLQTHTNYPRSIITFASPSKTVHPTQKPVDLFEYLIKTYTNEGETVLDNCSGSGTTAIAAINTGRRFICIERDPAYYYASCGRVWKACQT